MSTTTTKSKTRPTLNPRSGEIFSCMKTSSRHSMMTANKAPLEFNHKHWKWLSIQIERNSTFSSELQTAQEKPCHFLFLFSTLSSLACRPQKTKACNFLLIQKGKGSSQQNLQASGHYNRPNRHSSISTSDNFNAVSRIRLKYKIWKIEI